MLKKILIYLLFFTGIAQNSCVTTENGQIVSIDKISDQDYIFLTSELEILARLGTRHVVSVHETSKSNIKQFVSGARKLLSSEDNIGINVLADKLLKGVEDPDLKDAINLAILEIQKRGGFTYINLNGSQFLSQRSIGLIEALLNGIESAL